MNITEYAKLLTVTKLYDAKENLVYSYLKDIIDISTKMNYSSAIETVRKIIQTYGTIKTTKIDDKSVSYIIIKTPEAVKEQILNLKHQVKDQQERDMSEKILSFN